MCIFVLDWGAVCTLSAVWTGCFEAAWVEDEMELLGEGGAILCVFIESPVLLFTPEVCCQIQVSTSEEKG